MATSNLANRITLLAALSFMSTACGLFGPDVWQERRAELERQRAVWQRHEIHDYVFTLERFAFTADQHGFKARVRVEADTIQSATFTATGEPVPEELAGLLLTIDGFFDEIAANIEERPYRFNVEYDSVAGYPRSFSVNPSKQVADEEHGIGASDLAPF